MCVFLKKKCALLKFTLQARGSFKKIGMLPVPACVRQVLLVGLAANAKANHSWRLDVFPVVLEAQPRLGHLDEGAAGGGPTRWFPLR